MSLHGATVAWALKPDEDFARGRYSRVHSITFEGGVSIPGAASPAVVPLAYTSAEAVDPEAAFVAALASCHMLTFLDLARRAKFVLSSWEDHAEGVLEKRADGKMAVTRVTLRPKIAWSGEAPDEAKLSELHHQAHDLCFIANSVTTEVVVAQPAV